MNSVAHNKLLINESPLLVSPTLAVALQSADAAIALQQIHYWTQKCGKQLADISEKYSHNALRWISDETREMFDARQGDLLNLRWVYNSLSEWQKQFPWMSQWQLRNALNKLRELGILIFTQFEKSRYLRRGWYAIDYEKLNQWLNEKSFATCGSSHVDVWDSSRRDVDSITSSYIQENTKTEEYISEQQQYATAAGVYKNQLDSDLSLEPEILEEVEQSRKYDLDPHLIDGHEENHSLNDKTTLEDQNRGGAAKNEVVMTSNFSQLISVVLKNACLKPNSKLLQIISKYSLEQVCAAIAHLEQADEAKEERGEGRIENREGYLVEALRNDWASELTDRKGYVLEYGQYWMAAQTARLLGITKKINIRENSMVLDIPQKISVTISSFCQAIDQHGWYRFFVDVLEARREAKP
jgi:hypothetical protein